MGSGGRSILGLLICCIWWDCRSWRPVRLLGSHISRVSDSWGDYRSVLTLLSHRSDRLWGMDGLRCGSHSIPSLLARHIARVAGCVDYSCPILTLLSHWSHHSWSGVWLRSSRDPISSRRSRRSVSIADSRGRSCSILTLLTHELWRVALLRRSSKSISSWRSCSIHESLLVDHWRGHILACRNKLRIDAGHPTS